MYNLVDFLMMIFLLLAILFLSVFFPYWAYYANKTETDIVNRQYNTKYTKTEVFLSGKTIKEILISKNIEIKQK